MKRTCVVLGRQDKTTSFFSLMIFLYLNIYQKIKNLKETPTHSQQYYNVCQQTKFPRTEMGKKLFFFIAIHKMLLKHLINSH